MVLLGEGSVLALDGPVIGIVGNIQYLVIILRLGSFQVHLSLLVELSDSRRRRVVLLGVVEGSDTFFILLGVEFALCFGKEGREGVRVEV